MHSEHEIHSIIEESHIREVLLMCAQELSSMHGLYNQSDAAEKIKSSVALSEAKEILGKDLHL